MAEKCSRCGLTHEPDSVPLLCKYNGKPVFDQSYYDRKEDETIARWTPPIESPHWTFLSYARRFVRALENLYSGPDAPHVD